MNHLAIVETDDIEENVTIREFAIVRAGVKLGRNVSDSSARRHRIGGDDRRWC